MGFKKVVYFVSVIVLSFSAFAVWAEDAPPSGLTVNLFQVAPGKEPAFEQVSAKFKAAADKIGSPAYIGYSAAIGNDGQYAFVSAFNSYQEFANEQNILAEAYEGEELAEIGRIFQDSVTSTDSYVIVPRLDLGIPAPTFEKPPEILLLISVTLKIGMEPQYEEFLTKLVEATKATSPDTYYSAFQPGFGSGPIWRFGIPMNWADLDSPGKPIPQRLMEHFGKKNAEKINDKGQEAVERIEFMVSRIRTDLSHNIN